MYKKFFGFNQKPFSVTPDPTFYYPSGSHRVGLASLRYGIRERMGFVALTGEVGVGKTFLIRSLLQELGEDVKRALILNPILEPNELFEAILEDLEVPFDKEASFVSQLSAFNDYLLKEHKEGNLVVVIVDESQDLSTDALERLRLLSNLETETAKLLQIVLVGQPELNDLLALPVLRQLGQRIASRHRLEPFTKEETSEYIQHRLNVASSGEPKVSFDAGAIQRLYRASGGVPRVLGHLCEHALVTAFSQEERAVNSKIAKEAISKNRNRAGSTRPAPTPTPAGFRQWVPAAVGAACLLAAVALSASGFLSRGLRMNEEVGIGSSWRPEQEPLVVTAFPQPAVLEPLASTFEAENAVPVKQPLGSAPVSGKTESAETTSPADSPRAPAGDMEADNSIRGQEVGAVVEDTVDDEWAAPSEVSEVGEPKDPVGSPIDPDSAPRDAPVLQATQSPQSPESEIPLEMEPAKALEPMPVVASRETATRYGLQVASLQSIERAQHLADEIKRFGPVFLVPWKSEESEEWIRVVLGVYPSREAGEETLDLLSKETWTKGARVVENRWWPQVPSTERKQVFALAGE